jgi:hypothetical protein
MAGHLVIEARVVLVEIRWIDPPTQERTTHTDLWRFRCVWRVMWGSDADHRKRVWCFALQRRLVLCVSNTRAVSLTANSVTVLRHPHLHLLHRSIVVAICAGPAGFRPTHQQQPQPSATGNTPTPLRLQGPAEEHRKLVWSGAVVQRARAAALDFVWHDAHCTGEIVTAGGALAAGRSGGEDLWTCVTVARGRRRCTRRVRAFCTCAGRPYHVNDSPCPVRLAGGWWLVLICSERKVLLAGCCGRFVLREKYLYCLSQPDQLAPLSPPARGPPAPTNSPRSLTRSPSPTSQWRWGACS